MVDCPVCEENMEEADNEFCDDTFLESTSVTVTIRCGNDICPLTELELDYSYGGMINSDDIEIDKLKDEYDKRKFVEGI